MKKFLLVGMCGAMLAACDSANVEMEKYCLQSAENSGMEITEETRAHCKCVNEQLIESFGAEKTAAFAKFMHAYETQGQAAAEKVTAEYDFSLSPVYDSFLEVSIMCALESGLISEEDFAE